MFKAEHFRIRNKATWPPFSLIVQSWYSPFLVLNKRITNDYQYSSAVTFGVSYNTKVEITFISMFNKYLDDSIALINYIKSYSGDYLNKTIEWEPTVRYATTVVVPAYENEFNPLLKKIPITKLRAFRAKGRGGEDLRDQVLNIIPYCKHINFNGLPGKQPTLRKDDEFLINSLLSYPSEEAASITSAFAQGLLYLESQRLFEPEYVPTISDLQKKSGKGVKAFYGSES